MYEEREGPASDTTQTLPGHGPGIPRRGCTLRSKGVVHVRVSPPVRLEKQRRGPSDNGGVRPKTCSARARKEICTTQPPRSIECWSIPEAPLTRPLPDAGPVRPSPQSQSLSRGYGSNLPTSLTYIVLSTRGFSPWRPAADIGTAWHESHIVPRIFKGQRECTGHLGKQGALRDLSPLRGASPFQGVRSLK